MKQLGKRIGLGAARALGLFRAAGASRWRHDRLLILCYHGIALVDEQEWDPELYITAERFESRLRYLRDGGYAVLALGEAYARLKEGTLPPRAVTITFDDGAYDFQARAWPLLRRYGMPATLYLTTYYSERQTPVFPGFGAYMLWKAGVPPAERARRLADLTAGNQTASAKEEALRRLAEELRLDYAGLCRERILHLLSPDEVSRLAAEGLDVQLHTHRHRTPGEEALFVREIRDNRARIELLTGRPAVHFCYPSGVYKSEFLPWLTKEEVVTATTCEPGLASAGSSPLLLPRFIDTMAVTELDFASWTSGFWPRLTGR